MSLSITSYLGCLTGLRFSDFSVLEKPDIRGEFLYKKRQKSNHRVVIPLRQAAKEILEKRFKKDFVPLTNAEFNRHIKTVCKLAGITELGKHTYTKGNKKIDEVRPKCEWITTHTCRRSLSIIISLAFFNLDYSKDAFEKK